jgi:hypothetical protein
LTNRAERGGRRRTAGRYARSAPPPFGYALIIANRAALVMRAR